MDCGSKIPQSILPLLSLSLIHILSGMMVYTVRESKSGNAQTLQLSLPSRNMGIAGRFTYGYSDRYYAEFNFGYNGSERFDKNHRWGFFPSGGLGWMVSNEKFWKDKPITKVISSLKLKGSYGLVGNDNISDERFFYLSEVSMDGDNGMGFGTNFNAKNSNCLLYTSHTFNDNDSYQ